MNLKIGRNSPCPCGSSKKYKKCCMDKPRIDKPHILPASEIPADLKFQFEKMQAVSIQQEKQQGRGRPIISIEHQGYRLVATGTRIHYSKQWKTFHDFLLNYIKTVLGKEWGQAELKKPENDRHPIIQWIVKAAKHMRASHDSGVEIQAAPMTGAVFALLHLSYNLFLLEHNVSVQEKLIARLKNKEQFQGALYETFVSAVFIRAGFTIDPEDETNSLTRHCEFAATAPDTKAKYAVEAKAREPFKEGSAVSRHLGKALGKPTANKRIIFIDVNVPKLVEKMDSIDKELREKEISQAGEWKNAPPAYVFITNHSFAYDLEGMKFERMGFVFGFKTDYFRGEGKYTSLREARLARDKHMDIFLTPC